MEIERTRVSYSSLSSFMQCEMQSVMGQTYEPIVKARPPVLGTMVHIGMAAGLKNLVANNYEGSPILDVYEAVETYIKANKPTVYSIVMDGVTIVDAEQFDYDELGDIAVQIVMRTLDHLDLGPNGTWLVGKDDTGEPIIERKFVLPMTDDIDFVLVVDAILVEPKTGEAWVVDWKTRKSMQGDLLDNRSDVARDDFNVQVSLYQKALEPVLLGYGYYLNGAVVYQISDRLPEQPKQNKDGSMSRMRIKTDWDTYQIALLTADLNPLDYYDMRDTLQGVEFWRPLFIKQLQSEVDNRWSLMVQWANRYKLFYDFKNAPLRHISASCAYCPFAKVCLGLDRNHDIPELLETNYQKRERR